MTQLVQEGFVKVSELKVADPKEDSKVHRR